MSKFEINCAIHASDIVTAFYIDLAKSGLILARALLRNLCRVSRDGNGPSRELADRI